MQLFRYLAIPIFALFSNLAFCADFNFGDWRLGMSKKEVKQVYSLAPFTPVEVTGGFETSFKVFENTVPVSFVFENETLVYIQAFAYEGSDFSAAKRAAMSVLELFSSKFGGATIHGIKLNEDPWLSEETASFVLDRVLGTAPELSAKFKKEDSTIALFTFDASPKMQPENSKIHAKFVYSSRFETFYVFLFQDLIGSPERTAKAAIELEKL